MKPNEALRIFKEMNAEIANLAKKYSVCGNLANDDHEILREFQRAIEGIKDEKGIQKYIVLNRTYYIIILKNDEKYLKKPIV